MVGGKHAFTLVRDWLGESRPVDTERARAELARRYLAGHGPANDHDLARWAGIPLRDARAGLAAIGSALRDRSDGLVDLKRRPEAAPLPPPRLLGAYEPLLLGWRERTLWLGENDARVVSGGIFRAFALVRGRAVATWKLVAGGVVLEPFARLTRADRAALEADSAQVTRFLAD
jgi:hypothetical protein